MAAPDDRRDAARARPTRRAVTTGLLALPLAGAAGSGTLRAQTAPSTPATAPFTTAAPFAFLIDVDSDTVLFEKQADQLMPPASMAKLMTMAVVFEELRQGRLAPETEFTVSEDAWRRGGAPSNTSSMFAAINSRVKVQDLITGAIVMSGNDACIALAQGIAGNEGAFAQRMNQRAKEIGLTRSTFTNSTGLPDPNQRVTARELAMLAEHIIRTYPEQYRIYSQREFTWNNIRQFNRNPLLRLDIGADGLKTGQTAESGFGLVGSAIQNGQRLILVVNGLRSERDRADEARKILEWGFRTFESRLLFAEGATVGEAQVFGGASGRVALTGKGPIRLLVPRGVQERITARIVYRGPIRAPVVQGAEVARLKVLRGDNVALDVPLIAAAEVPVGALHQRAFDAVSEFVGGLIRSGAERL